MDTNPVRTATHSPPHLNSAAQDVQQHPSPIPIAYRYKSPTSTPPTQNASLNALPNTRNTTSAARSHNIPKVSDARIKPSPKPSCSQLHHMPAREILQGRHRRNLNVLHPDMNFHAHGIFPDTLKKLGAGAPERQEASPVDVDRLIIFGDGPLPAGAQSARAKL